MNRTWDFKINCDYSTISSDEYNQVLDEWAELVYSHFCQHNSDSATVPVTSKKAGA